jgi:hypothetical protein
MLGVEDVSTEKGKRKVDAVRVRKRSRMLQRGVGFEVRTDLRARTDS